jgi:hypothetical protein
MSDWYKWQSLADFDSWHNQIKEQLGIPKLSSNSDGNIVDDSTITDSYTTPFIVSDSDVRAVVENKHNAGLVPSEQPYEEPERIIT